MTRTGLPAAGGLRLKVKNGDATGTVVGSYEDFAIRAQVKKGRSNLPENKDGGRKMLEVSANNGDVWIEFVGEGIR